MSLTQQIDVYCERTDFTFWSEPINAITNAAFIIAGIFAWRLYRQNGQHDIYAPYLIGLMFAIGIGSFLFHTLATRWAGLVDIIPIGLIIFTFHVAMMHRVAGWSIYVSVLSLGIIPMFGYIAYQLPLEFMGSTKAYSPILPLLLIYAYYAPQRVLLLATFATFGISMTFRIMDDHICDVFPYGVHWMWHILNGTSLYLAFCAYILSLKN